MLDWTQRLKKDFLHVPKNPIDTKLQNLKLHKLFSSSEVLGLTVFVSTEEVSHLV